MTIQAAAVPMRLSVDITNLPAVYVSDTVSVYQVGTCGWFILRRTEFTDEDWLGACEVIGPDTYLDPGEWEALQGAETMFLPDPAFMPRSLSLAV